jgi:small subunit ribosomal protein S15
VSQLVKETQRFQPGSRSVLQVGGVVEDDDEDDGPSAEDYIVNVGDLEGDDQEAGIEDDGQPPAWAVSQQRIDELRVQFRRHEKDTGSPEYQIAGITERIAYLTKHLKVHPKDFSTRRGLVALVNNRRRLLNYLSSENVERYKEVVASLGIRHKAPGNVPNKEEKYGRFPSQKAIKKHLVVKKRSASKK